MKKLITTSFMMLTAFVGLAQTVIDAKEIDELKKDGVTLAYYNDAPYSGIVTEHFDNGKLKLWKNVKNGRTDGKWQEWLKNGNLRYNAYWKAGKGHGLWQYFHDNGTIRYEESYLDDIPNGISRAYYNSGQLQHDFFWLKGKKHGDWSYYSETGKLIKTEIYNNNELISTNEIEEQK